MSEVSSAALMLAHRALAEPIRLRILQLLRQNESLCVCQLMAVLVLPWSSLSRHLQQLKAAQLVSDEKRGRWVYYSLRRDRSPLGEIMQISLDLYQRSEAGQCKLDLARLESTLKLELSEVARLGAACCKPSSC